MLSGQQILITGANSGIGRSICKTLLKNNAKLILFYHKNRDAIDELQTKYQSLIQSHQVDLLNTSQVESVMLDILKTKSIDCFIHCVSLPLKVKNFTNLTWDDIESHIEIQTRSFFQIVKNLVPLMKTRKHGKIISILTSAVINKPPTNMLDYIVGKYSL